MAFLSEKINELDNRFGCWPAPAYEILNSQVISRSGRWSPTIFSLPPAGCLPGEAFFLSLTPSTLMITKYQLVSNQQRPVTRDPDPVHHSHIFIYTYIPCGVFCSRVEMVRGNTLRYSTVYRRNGRFWSIPCNRIGGRSRKSPSSVGDEYKKFDTAASAMNVDEQSSRPLPDIVVRIDTPRTAVAKGCCHSHPLHDAGARSASCPVLPLGFCRMQP